MKKLVSLFLTVILIIIIGTYSFAAQGDTNIPDPAVPAAPAENVEAATYDEPQITIDDEEIPTGTSDTSSETTEIKEETVPKGDVLPKTGGIPAEAFYAAGALFVAAALILSRKKTATKG